MSFTRVRAPCLAYFLMGQIVFVDNDVLLVMEPCPSEVVCSHLFQNEGYCPGSGGFCDLLRTPP